jgi:hypothetical protein
MNEGRVPPPCTRQQGPSGQSLEDLALTGLLPVGKVVTMRGELPAEKIEAGDIIVVMATIGYSPVQRAIETMVDLTRRPDAAPLLIVEGAFGRFSPNRTTILAPQSLIGVENWLVPASTLVNARSIRQLPAAGYIRYLQFEMGHHDMFVADGLRVGSLSRGMTLCRPLLTNGLLLDGLRTRIAERIPVLEASGRLPRGGFR